jgi:hypothetical protein
MDSVADAKHSCVLASYQAKRYWDALEDHESTKLIYSIRRDLHNLEEKILNVRDDHLKILSESDNSVITYYEMDEEFDWFSYENGKFVEHFVNLGTLLTRISNHLHTLES